eukprot:scaffold824_cov129-Cylindrotheca_fusiformis.AAC.5
MLAHERMAQNHDIITVQTKKKTKESRIGPSTHNQPEKSTAGGRGIMMNDDTTVTGNDQAVATAANEDRTEEEPNGEEDESAALASPTGHNYLRDETVVTTVGQGAGEEEEEEECYDVDENGNPAHILDLTGHSVLSKEASALKHFDQFLAQYLLNSGRLPVRTHDQLLFEEIDSHLLGSFATYLLQKAKSRKAVSAQRLSGGHSPAALSYQTALSYLTAVQSYYGRLFKRDFKDFSCFGSQWKKMLAILRTQFNNRGRIEGKRLVVPKTIGQQSDYLSIATLCIWDGRNEIASLRHEHISVVTKQEDFQRSYHMAQVQLNNWKQATCQDLHVFPHIDSWFMDFYFASAVFLSVSGEASPYLCPSFAKTVVTYGTSNKTNTSGVSRYWSSCLAQLRKYHQSTQDELTGDILIGIAEKLCCHSGRKHVIEEMGQANISTRAQDVEAAKSIAGWRTKFNGDAIWGGYPNEVEDLTVAREKFEPFLLQLFHTHAAQMNPIFMKLQGFAILRFLKDFTAQASRATWNTGVHPFLASVKAACVEAAVSENEFEQWQTDICGKFRSRNGYVLGTTREEFMVDGRNLINVIHEMKNSQRALAETNMQLERTVHNLQHQLEELLPMVHSSLTTSPSNTTNHGTTNNNGDGLLLEEEVDRYESLRWKRSGLKSIWIDTVGPGRHTDLEVLFKFWFLKELPLEFEADRLLYGGKKENALLWKQIQSTFGRMKKAMEVLIKSLSSYPPPRPPNAADLPEWEVTLGQMGKAALQEICRSGGKAEDTVLSINYLERRFKDDKISEKHWPVGTPIKEVEWFNKRAAGKQDGTTTIVGTEEGTIAVATNDTGASNNSNKRKRT